jgi:hypothetical protein
MQFAWRVYYPPNYAQKLTHNSGGSVHSTSSGSSEFLGRVIFREDKNGMLQVFTRFANGSTRVTGGDQELARLLHDRWNEIRVEQLGADKTVAIDPAQSACLLRLTLPSDLEAATKNKLPRPLGKYEGPVLYELWLGPKAFQP